jgi:transcriptional regulator CtsR
LRGNRIVSDIHVIRIREMYSTGNYSQAELARMFSLVPSQVSHIVRGSRKYILESERN